MQTFKIPTIFTAVDKMSAVVKGMENNVQAFAARSERRFLRTRQAASKVAMAGAAVGTALLTPLALAAKEAMDFEDKLADVAKTTGLQNQELSNYGSEILKFASKTRTSIDDLLKISEIGGQLGIAKHELLGFTHSVNQFNVALGKDFSGGVEEAASSIGKIKSLFKETRAINIAESITRAGSAINELGAQGAGTSANITDFTLRMGALPDALKPSLVNTLALGTYFEELGLNTEVASGGLTNFLLVAGKHMGGFARQMRISRAAAKELLMQDPTEFAKKFAVSFKGMAPDKVAKKLHALRIGTQESVKVIGALASSTERLNYLQNLSNKSFQEGTSLQAEYDKKNNTTRANIQKAINNFKSFAITIGTELLPAINSLVQIISPMFSRLIEWAKLNRGTVKTILKIVGVVGTLAFVLSGLATVVAAFTGLLYLQKIAMVGYNVVLGISMALQGKSAFYTAGSTVAYKAYRATVIAAEGAQWLLNAAMMASPVGISITAVLALTAAVGYLIYNQRRLREEYEKNLALRIVDNKKSELETLEKLISRYRQLGMGIREATLAAIKFERANIAMQQSKLSAEIGVLEQKAQKEKINFGSFGMMNTPASEALFEKALAKRQIATNLSAQNVGLLEFAKQQGFEKIDLADRTTTNNAKVTVDFKNLPAGATVSSDGQVRTTTNSVIPNTSSTMRR